MPENMPWVLLRRVGVGTRPDLFEGALAGVRFWGRHHPGVGRRDLQRIDPAWSWMLACCTSRRNTGM